MFDFFSFADAFELLSERAERFIFMPPRFWPPVPMLSFDEARHVYLAIFFFCRC